MMAMGLPDMVLKWDTREKRREVGCMNRKGKGSGTVLLLLAIA